MFFHILIVLIPYSILVLDKFKTAIKGEGPQVRCAQIATRQEETKETLDGKPVRVRKLTFT